jgi:hypothetical protein
MLWYCMAELGLSGNDKRRLSSLYYNAQSITTSISPILKRAGQLYKERAFIHWYEKYSKTDVSGLFENAFESLRNVNDSYATLPELC